MVKRLFLAVALVALLCSAGAGAQGLKGQMNFNIYGGYTVGLGSPFEENDYSINFPNIGVSVPPLEGTLNLDPQLGGGASFYYGVAERVMIGVDLSIQQYKVEESVEEWTLLSFNIPAMSASETQSKIIASLNAMYAIWLNENGDAVLLTAGGAVYGGLGGILDPNDLDDVEKFDELGIGDVAFGINAGLMLRKMVAETVGIFVSPRFHFAFSDPAAKMLQIAGGVTFAFGGE